MPLARHPITIPSYVMWNRASRARRHLAGWTIFTAIAVNEVYAFTWAAPNAAGELSMIGALFAVPAMAIACIVSAATTP